MQHLFRFHTWPPPWGEVGTFATVVCACCREGRSRSQTWGWLLVWANPQRTMTPVLEYQCGHPADCEAIDHRLTPPDVGREAGPGEYGEMGYDVQREG